MIWCQMRWRKCSFVKSNASLLLLALACLAFTGPAFADKRVALVVGNSSYKNVTRLDNPANDAKLMAETLRGLGFTLVGDGAQIDLDKAGIDRAVQAFGAQLRGAAVGLFYYAGHGVQVRGSNYLVPTDANPVTEADVDFQMLDTNLVLRQMASAGTRLNIVVLDACRNNPFGGRGLRATGGGLAQMQAPEGTIISYATQPGNVAQDGTDGHSPFTKALAQAVRQPGLDIFRTFNEVGLAVMQGTNNDQQPWLSSSPIRGEFYFGGAAAASGVTAAAPSTATSSDKLLLDVVTDCDRLAGNPTDTQLPRGAGGAFYVDTIDLPAAVKACDDAIRQFPSVARFAFQRGRVARAQKDYDRARQQYELAIGMGSNMALNGMGFLYQRGFGVPKNITLAREYYEKAAAAREPNAMYNLGLDYQNGEDVAQDYVHARQLFEKAAAGGDATAMNQLGILYQRGLGVAVDFAQARQWYERGAAAGVPDAVRNIGLLFEFGRGVAVDFGQARQYYERAAAAGNSDAMRNLGLLYENGRGVPRDLTLAQNWYEKALAAGNEAASKNLEALKSTK